MLFKLRKKIGTHWYRVWKKGFDNGCNVGAELFANDLVEWLSGHGRVVKTSKGYFTMGYTRSDILVGIEEVKKQMNEGKKNEI